MNIITGLSIRLYLWAIHNLEVFCHLSVNTVKRQIKKKSHARTCTGELIYSLSKFSQYQEQYECKQNVRRKINYGTSLKRANKKITNVFFGY